MAVTVAARGVRAAGLKTSLGRSARRLLAGLDLGGAELSVLLVSDVEMQRLNRDWRGKDRPTDVLAFAQAEEGPAPDGLLHLLGYDHERSAREAARMKRKERELAGWLR